MEALLDTGAYEVTFDAYDSESLRLLSAALCEAMENVQNAEDRQLTESELAGLSKRMTDILMTAFARGVRDPAALKDAALHGASGSSPD